ncbi:prenyltransferase/squalene oxidase repeat-containing protein [Rubritalea tangerina]|uniref:Prenyltransferase/squalene oxidase repeat-containing protein n=1 Tax=Rubritalea tangerina TaxID=430798 RepID=A0ABW4ZFP2_9BACT
MKRFIAIALTGLSLTSLAPAQSIERRQEDPIPAKVETMYTRGLKYLASSQAANGSWEDNSGSYPGVVGLATLAFLAHGEDPNHGPYAKNIQRTIDYLIKSQRADNGYIGTSMYNHGFATLALAEAYGVVDDPRIEKALEKAVDLILSAQKRNPKGAWRYSPDSKDADTTISGCQIVALLAARNAGVAVPDAAIERALKYMASCRDTAGAYGYTSRGGGKVTLTAIGSLCYSLAKQKDAKGFQSSLDYLKKNLEYRDTHYTYYFEYYMSQALFQADEETWKLWNAQNIRLMAATQQQSGAWLGNRGPSYSTASALLSLALNYRYLPIYEK